MSLPAGTRLGPYEILAPLGAGGMGEVYCARDTKLGRDVAIKIVSDGFGHEPERLARFQREAHLLASLNHPHIAAIYGLEEANGSQFLVLELVEGETLAERLKSGPLPVPEALSVARQIADALQAAHEKGIIHRDLKPANIAFTADGQVKVLDFGLAKELETSPSDLANSPTMTLGGTQAGVILGTAAYMAPEQAKGRVADKRSDVWAFGCVLFEMLSGRRAFEGDGVNDTLAAVLRGEPNWTALPAKLPPAFRTVLGHCLNRDRNQRLADISTAHFLLTNPAVVASVATGGADPFGATLLRRAVIPTAAWLLGLAMAGTATWVVMRKAVELPRVSRLQITPEPGAALVITGTERDLAITPDGTRIIYRGANSTLFVRALNELDATPLTVPGSSTAGPFISPDGQWIGFSDARAVRKVAITGGPSVSLADLDGSFQGASWSPDGSVVFATSSPTTGLKRVGSSGGVPTVLTTPDPMSGEADHLFPHILPGGRAVLFTITATAGGLDQAQIAVLDFATGTHMTLIRGGSDAHYVASNTGSSAGSAGAGHLVYGANGALRAVAFDLARLAVVGTPSGVIPRVVTTNVGAVDVGVSSNGTLVYVPGVATSGGQRTMVWVDRQGHETAVPVEPRPFDQPRVSPDGTRVVLHGNDQELDLWSWDLTRGVLARLTFDPTNDLYPVWMSDGSRVIFSSERGGGRNLFTQTADGTGTVTRLTESPNSQNAHSLSPDQTLLVFTETGPKTGADVMQLRLDGTRQSTPLVQTAFTERNAEVSPDGHWLAYEANDSGPTEVYVRPFPEVTSGRWQVSTGGGRQPLWSRNGDELFYLAPNGELMAVGVKRGRTWQGSAPSKLLDGRYYAGTSTQVARQYDIAPDGRRFLMLKPSGAPDSAAQNNSIVVIQHFDEELKRLVPAE